VDGHCFLRSFPLATSSLPQSLLATQRESETAESKARETLHLAQKNDPKSAESLPPRGGSGCECLDDLDASSNGGLRRRRRAARRAPAHHPAVAEEAAAAHGAEKVRREDYSGDGGDGDDDDVRSQQQRPGVCGAPRVLEALLLLPQGPGRHHGRLRVQVRPIHSSDKRRPSSLLPPVQ